MLNKEITLNSIEHFMFCPFQWWLIYVENEWEDNIHTIQGNIVHSKVDNPKFIESRGCLRVERSVPLYSDKLGLYGIADLIEYKYKGEKLDSINIIEYKKGKPNEDKQVQLFDGMQLYAQMLCAREIFKCDVSGYIYYASIKKRVKLADENKFSAIFYNVLSQMREFMENCKSPKKNIGKHCNACSLKDVCLPFVGGDGA
ncbi:MAG: CRISPR-associated protein Cas4 [Christensenellales bacterium]